MKDQKKLGVSISYLNLALSTITNIFLTPFLIRMLGDDSYSLYKVMHSFAGPLVMFNLGVSTIVARAIVKYETLEERNLKAKQNTLALAMLTSTVMAVLVAVVGCVMCGMIPAVYGANYGQKMIRQGQTIFLIFVLSTIFHILTDAFNGCAIGHERFAFNAGLSLLKNVLRAPLIVVVLAMGGNAVAVAIIDCIVAFLIFALSSGYTFIILKERPKLAYIAKRELLEMLSFSAAILMQAIVNQVNNNVDTMLLGAMIPEKWIITMYSSALLVYGTYNSIVSVMASFFLPKATRLVTSNATGEELTDFVIKPGRYQAMIAVAIVAGFVVLGKTFITIWIGSQYIDAYYVILMLMIPVTIPLVENTAISILDASLKRIYRSVVLVVMAVINVFVSVILIKRFNFWGAAMGTCLSLCIGHIILMNLYYARTFGMNIPRMFSSIFQGILPMGLLTILICVPLNMWNTASIVGFLVKGILFVMVYSVLVWRWGLRQDERSYIRNTFHIGVRK